MQKRIVGLFSFPWDPGFRVAPRPRGNPALMYRWAVWYKANPRSADYMRALFAERYPDGEFIDVAAGDAWRTAVAEADIVVLLYPDAIGLGWGGLEHLVQAQAKTWASIRVLNGRKRDFLLYGGMQRTLKLRRFIEVTMLGELLVLAPFVALTPVLLAWDWMRGKR